MRRRKFLMYDRDEAKYKIIPTNNIVNAIYYAWNYEFEVFERDSKEPLFSPFDSNECNSDLLKKYGLQVIDYKEKRLLQSIETKKIYKEPWGEM